MKRAVLILLLLTMAVPAAFSQKGMAIGELFSSGLEKQPNVVEVIVKGKKLEPSEDGVYTVRQDEAVTLFLGVQYAAEVLYTHWDLPRDALFEQTETFLSDSEQGKNLSAVTTVGQYRFTPLKSKGWWDMIRLQPRSAASATVRSDTSSVRSAPVQSFAASPACIPELS